MRLTAFDTRFDLLISCAFADFITEQIWWTVYIKLCNKPIFDWHFNITETDWKFMTNWILITSYNKSNFINIQ